MIPDVKRRLLQLLLAIGALLTLAALVFSVRSFRVMESVRIGRQWIDADRRTYACADLSVNCGQVQLLLRHHRRTSAQIDPAENFQDLGFVAFHFAGDADPSYVRRADVGAPPWEPLGFVYRRQTPAYRWSPPGLNDWEFNAPAWFVVLTCAALTAIPYASLRRDARRRRRGLCPTCGYDLRGAKHERCPECGETVAPAVNAPAQV